jgi:hypothetical protein
MTSMNTPTSSPLVLGSSPQTHIRLWVLASSIVAAAASGLIGETPLVRVKAPEVTMTVMGRTFESSTPQGRQAAEDASAVRFQGLFGGLLGLALGLAGGLSLRTPHRAALAGLIGALSGTLFAATTARVSIPFYHSLQRSVSNDLIASLALHASVYAAAGAAGGFALGLGLGLGRDRWATAVLAGALSAAIGAAAFEVLGAVVLATSETGHPLASTATARLLAPLLVSGLFAIGVAGSLSHASSSGLSLAVSDG